MGSVDSGTESLTKARRWFLVVWTIIGIAGLAVIASYALNILSVPVGVLVWTVIIVFCLRGPVSWFEAHNIQRGVATVLAFVIMFIILGIIVFLMVSPTFGMGAQFESLVQSMPGYVSALMDWATAIYNQYAYIFGNDTVQQYIQEGMGEISKAAQDFARSGASGIMQFGSGVANMFMIIGFALVIAFWILMELPGIGRECNRLITGSKHEEDWRMLHITLTRVMGGYIKATLLQCAVIAVVCGILFAVLGVPNFAAVALITGVLNIIPVVGPWLGGAIAAILALFASPLVAAIVLIGTIAIQQFVYTFVSPAIMQDSVDIHPALTLLCLIVGSALGGTMSGLMGSILGMLVSIPAAAVIKSMFVYYFEKSTGRQLVAEDGVFFQGTPSEGEGVDPLHDASSPHPGTTEKFKKIGPVGYEAMVDKKQRKLAVKKEKDRVAASKEARKTKEKDDKKDGKKDGKKDKSELRSRIADLHLPGEDQESTIGTNGDTSSKDLSDDNTQ